MRGVAHNEFTSLLIVHVLLEKQISRGQNRDRFQMSHNVVRQWSGRLNEEERGE